MTRETKVGLVVTCSFLCLVGVVLYCKIRDNRHGKTDQLAQVDDLPKVSPVELVNENNEPGSGIIPVKGVVPEFMAVPAEEHGTGQGATVPPAPGSAAKVPSIDGWGAPSPKPASAVAPKESGFTVPGWDASPKAPAAPAVDTVGKTTPGQLMTKPEVKGTDPWGKPELPEADEMAKKLTAEIQAAGKQATGVKDAAVGVVKDAGQQAVGVKDAAVGTVKEAQQQAGGFKDSAWGTVKDAEKQAKDAAAGAVKEAQQQIGGLKDAVWGTVTDAGKQAAGMKDAAVGGVKDVTKEVEKQAAGVKDAALGAADSLLSKTPPPPSLSGGTPPPPTAVEGAAKDTGAWTLPGADAKMPAPAPTGFQASPKTAFPPPTLGSSTPPPPALDSGSPPPPAALDPGAKLLRPESSTAPASASLTPGVVPQPRVTTPPAGDDAPEPGAVRLIPQGTPPPPASQFAQGPTPAPALDRRFMPPVGSAPVTGSPPIALPTPGSIPPSGAITQSIPPSGAISQVESYDEETYVAQAGDTFAEISKKQYLTDRYKDALLQFNRTHPRAADNIKQDPPMLRVGQAVYIPPLFILQKRYAGAIQEGATGAAPAGLAPVATGLTPMPLQGTVATKPTTALSAPTGGEKRYRVRQDGEMFLGIAQATLGNGNRWAEIYNLNPQFDPANPLRAGTVLRLPGDARIDPANVPQ